jgi:hypothetical protein
LHSIWPLQLEALADELRLKIGAQFFVGMDCMGHGVAVAAEGDQRAGGLANVPFDRMEAIAAIGDVRTKERRSMTLP